MEKPREQDEHDEIANQNMIAGPGTGSSIRQFVYNKDFVIIVGDNGSGKTTLVRNVVTGVPKQQVYILNASGQRWDFPKRNITHPLLYTKEWFNSYIVKFLATHSNCTLVLDDADNFDIKKNQYLRSLIINARHVSVGVVLSIRQVQDLDKLIYKQAKCYIARQAVRWDMQYVAKFMPEELAYELKDLPPYTFLNYYQKTSEARLFKVDASYARRWDSYTTRT